jgi:hypothetical protein
MNDYIDLTIPSHEIPHVRIRALDDAWADDAKLADAFDNDDVLRLVRKLHYCKPTAEAFAETAQDLHAAINSALLSDPSFCDWCDEARLNISRDDAA